LVMTVAAYWKW